MRYLRNREEPSGAHPAFVPKRVAFAAIAAMGLCVLQFLAPLGAAADVNQDLLNCSTDGNHWRARAVSGNAPVGGGTGNEVYTPGSWSANGSSTWDEAAWTVNDWNVGNSLEVGMFTGYFPYTNQFFTWVSTYITEGNGNIGQTNYTGVPANDWVWMLNGGNYGIFQWDGATQSAYYPSYGINGPPVNTAQGEVPGGGAWMGNGSGYYNLGAWSPDGGNYYWWGYLNACWNPSYWVQITSPDSWYAGGWNP